MGCDGFGLPPGLVYLERAGSGASRDLFPRGRISSLLKPLGSLSCRQTISLQKQRPAHDDALRGLARTMTSPQMMCIRAKADIVEKLKQSHRTERVGRHGYPDTSHHYCSCSPPWRRRLVRPGTLVLGSRQGGRRGVNLIRALARNCGINLRMEPWWIANVAPGRRMLSDHAATSNHWRIWLGRRHPTRSHT